MPFLLYARACCHAARARCHTARSLALLLGLKLSDKPSGQLSGDPSGYTASDVLYGGSAGHILGVGIVLGLRATGAL